MKTRYRTQVFKLSENIEGSNEQDEGAKDPLQSQGEMWSNYPQL